MWGTRRVTRAWDRKRGVRLRGWGKEGLFWRDLRSRPRLKTLLSCIWVEGWYSWVFCSLSNWGCLCASVPEGNPTTSQGKISSRFLKTTSGALDSALCWESKIQGLANLELESAPALSGTQWERADWLHSDAYGVLGAWTALYVSPYCPEGPQLYKWT